MKKKGFTIIELLTVIAIIVMLIGLLIPSTQKAKQIASRLTERSQLRGIEIGLEAWANEQDMEYPDSTVLNGASFSTNGAHMLAEALIGRDGHGFDSNSTWNAENDESDNTIYDTTATTYYNRTDTYLEMDNIGFSQIAQIYDYATTSSLSPHPYPGDYDEFGTATGNSKSLVFTDVFKKKRVTTPIRTNMSGVSVSDEIKVGMPVLYFKAKDTYVFNSLTPNTSIYNYFDNSNIMMLGNNLTAENHPFYSDAVGQVTTPDQISIDKFYEWLINPSVSGGVTPYHKNSYILLSAGPDGLYGTKDDIHNISGKD
jgi:prepilin-type N-terminal cleavage/methylation domain-containing protein